MSPTWQDEFSEDFAVPAELSADPELVDVSWHNDVCPSFSPKAVPGDSDMDIRLWVEHPDHSMRESCSTFRFMVAKDSEEVWSGDDVKEAAKQLKAVTDDYAE